MEIKKTERRTKLQKKIIPLAMAAILTVQGTSVPVYGSVTVDKGVKPAYQVNKKTVVADVDAKNLTLEANKKIKITATGYTVEGEAMKPHTGAYVLTTNGNPVADANIEIMGNADVTLKDCYLTSNNDISAANKGLFSFSGGKVNLKLVGTNSIYYTGNEDTYSIGSKSANEDLAISGEGKLYLKNVKLGADNIKITNSKVYSDKEIAVDRKLELTEKSVLAVDKLNLGASQTLALNGDVVLYLKTEDGGYTPELTKGVIYRGTTVTLTSPTSEKLENGLGILHGNPYIPELNRPNNSKLLIDINKDDVKIKDVEYTGRDAEPEITVEVNRHIGGNKIFTKDEYTAVITGDKVNVGEKNIEIRPISAPNIMYRGEVRTTFRVTPKDITNATVAVDLYDRDYRGTEQTVEVKAVTLGGITLNASTDYTVTGNKATNAGEYTLKIEGAGNYGEKIEKKWKINKAPLAISEAAIAPKTYNGNVDATVTAVTLAGIKTTDNLVRDTDYDITGTFSDKNAGTGKTVIVKLTLKGTDKAKNYKIVKDTVTLTGQEIKKGKFNKPNINGTRYVDEDDPDNKFKYVVSEDATGFYPEYQMDGTDEGKWQDSNVFKGIMPGSTHTFYMRRKATENMNASEYADKPVTFTKIDNPNKPVLQFKVTDSATSGKKKITIVTVAGVEYKFDADPAYSDSGIKDEIASNASVVIKARFKATNTRNASSDAEQTVNVSKNTYNAPAPKLEEGTYYVDPSNANKFEYRVKTVEAAPVGKTYEYSNDLVNWITPAAVGGAVTFGAITPETTVNFYARIKADAEDGAGIQGSRTVTFNKLKRNELPTLNVEVGGAKGDKTVTIAAVEYARYKFGDGNWQDERVKEHIADEKITVGIYIKETVTHKASEKVFKEIVLNEKENNSSSNNSGGIGSPVVPEMTKEDKQEDNKQENKKPESSKNMDKTDAAKEETKPVAKVTAEAVSKKKARVNVSLDEIQNAIEAAKDTDKAIVKLKVAAPKGTKSVDVKLTEGVLGNLIDSAIKTFEVTATKVKVQFENKALALISKKSKGDVTLSITSVTKLSAAEKKIAGKRPVYNISLKAGETKITNLGEGKVKISIPYNKPVSEKASGLYAAYLNKKGNTIRIKAYYSAKNKTLTFSTKYLAKYIIGYKAPKKNK